MGITVTDSDLREMIVQIPEFQKNGTFDPDTYQRLLAANHLTPKVFEEAQTKEILGNKARMLVRDAVALTPSEIAEGQTLITRQPDTVAGQDVPGHAEGRHPHEEQHLRQISR